MGRCSSVNFLPNFGMWRKCVLIRPIRALAGWALAQYPPQGHCSQADRTLTLLDPTVALRSKDIVALDHSVCDSWCLTTYNYMDAWCIVIYS
jgi:hypothetical protein